VALLLNALAAADPSDPAGPSSDRKRPDDYRAGLKADALKGRRFGVLRQAMGYHPDVDASLERALEALKTGGAVTVDVKMSTYNRWSDAELEVLLYEFKDGLNAYLTKAASPRQSLEGLIAWNKANAAQVMPYFGQELFERAQSKGPLTDGAYRKASQETRRLAGKDGLLALLDREKLDAIIAPSMSPAWTTDHVLGDHFVGTGAGYSVAAVAGTPSLTVPSGDSRGLPLGMTFMGRAFSEADLLAFGFAFEQATKARRAPQYRPTLEQ
ncbi:MAG: amidase, partial [Acidobacteria bacterium]